MTPDSEIYAGLTEIFHEVFMREDLHLTATLSARDLKGWDSFKQIVIILATEQRFQIKLHTRELDSLGNVGDLVRVIAAKIALKQ